MTDVDIDKLFKQKKSRKNADMDGFALGELPDTDDIRELCEASQKDVFKVYRDLMTDEEVPPTVRLAAANAIADRGLGKPEKAAAPVAEVKTPQLGLDEIARRMTFALRDARERGTLPTENEVAPDDQVDEQS